MTIRRLAPFALFLFAVPALFVVPARAAQIKPAAGVFGKGDKSLTIDANDGIEWRQDSKVVIARGNARASRGDLTVAADVLKAHYRKDAKGNAKIWLVDAIGNVLISTPKQRAYGDRGTYNLDTGIFELTGNNLRIVGDKQTITARDKIEYQRKGQVARALGDATATQGDKKLRADVITAYFRQGKAGKLALKTVVAVGHVVVTTAREVARAKRAEYDAIKDRVTLSGNVKLTRGANQLDGEYAEVNLKTGVSRLLARPRGASGGKPVHGLFVPGKDSQGSGFDASILGGPKATKKKPKSQD